MSASNRPKNLYEILMDDLMAKIQNQEFTYEKPFCTEKQLAEEYDVSNITAKRAIKELELRGILYRKRGVGSFVARQPEVKKAEPASAGSAKVYAFVSPFIMSPASVFTEMIQRMNYLLNANRGFISPFVTSRPARSTQEERQFLSKIGKDISTERKILLDLLEQGISGLLFYPQGDKIHLDIMWKFVAKGIPVVILNKTEPVTFLHNVVCDNYGGQKGLCSQLITLGHRRIAYFASPPLDGDNAVAQRLGGYLAAFQEASLPIDPQLVHPDIDKALDGAGHKVTFDKLERIRELIRLVREKGATAIQCDNDGLAYYVIRCCEEMGIQVPADISVTGFDGYKNDMDPERQISSVFQDFAGIADEVGKLFLEHISGSTEIRKICVPAEILLGQTMGPCK